jgi:hypothetical protein
MEAPTKPAVSIVLVSDYGAGEQGSFDDLHTALDRLDRQDFQGRVERMLVESSRFREATEKELATRDANLHIVYSDVEDSFALKNVGAEQASADIIVFLDMDCVPQQDWLRHLVEAFDRHPNAAVVNGRTTYGEGSVTKRSLALLSRAYVDRGSAGLTRHISNNNAAFRRDWVLKHPFPSGANPFLSGLHAGAILHDGGEMWFEPNARVVHAFHGWDMERDVSRNAGWSTVTLRKAPSHARMAWLVRLGVLSIPIFWSVCVARSTSRVLRLWRCFDLKVYEIPIALSLAVTTATLQIPGMWAAFRGEVIGETAYR